MDLGFFISVFSFLKELVFGKTQNGQRVPIGSKFRKWLILILIVISLSLNYITIIKIFKLTSAYVAIAQEKKKIEEELKKREGCEITLKTLQDLINAP